MNAVSSSTDEQEYGVRMSHVTGDTQLYSSSDHAVKTRRYVDPVQDGIKKIVGKYESPENLMINPAALPKANMNGLDKPGSGPAGGQAMSDCSSDLSDAAPTWSTTINVATSFAEGVTEQDVLQAETFYKSHKTEVCVCRCLANLYYNDAKNRGGGGSKWEFNNTGIPVLVLDTGEHHRQRKLSIILAEKGTGFTLWKDVIDQLTKYSLPSDKFHTMYLSTDHTKQAGLSFDDGNAATEFYTFISNLITDPRDDLFNLSSRKKNKKKKEKSKYKAPKKTDISQPCCFVHVTKLERPDFPPPPSRLVGDLTEMLGNNQLVIPRSASSVSEDSASQSAASETS